MDILPPPGFLYYGAITILSSILLGSFVDKFFLLSRKTSLFLNIFFIIVQILITIFLLSLIKYTVVFIPYPFKITNEELMQTLQFIFVVAASIFLIGQKNLRANIELMKIKLNLI